MLLQRGHLYEFGEFCVDMVQRRLLHEGKIVTLTHKVFDLLVVLVEGQGRILSKEELLKAVWPETYVEEGNLTQNISVLRKALTIGESSTEYIDTVPRQGYRFIVPVREVSSASEEIITVDRTRSTVIEEETSSGSSPVEVLGGWRTSVTLAVVLLVGTSMGAWLANVGDIRTKVAQPQIRTIGVLPLRNLSRDPEQEYFSDGTTEALISNLAQLHSLRVISHTSVMRYKRTDKPIRQIGQELGADAIIEGSVQRAGSRVRVTAQLINVATDTNIWSHEYNRELCDVLNIEAEIASAVAHAVQAQLTPNERSRLAETHSLKPAAQEAYLHGRYHVQRWNATDLRLAVDYFERAVKEEPGFAAAYAGLANAWGHRGIWGGLSFREVQTPARQAAQKALDLDSNLSQAHTALGHCLWTYDWNWTGAGREFRRAIELAPNSVEAHSDYANMLMALGRHAEAIAESQRAATLDPVSSASQSRLGRVLFRARRYDEAAPHFQLAIELDPRNFSAYLRLAELYEKKGDLPRALDLVERGLRNYGGEPPKSLILARLYALLGRRTDALHLIEASKKELDPNIWVEISLVYFALGDEEDGFHWLTKAFDEHGLVVYVKEDPRFDRARADPRFNQLVARLNMP